MRQNQVLFLEISEILLFSKYFWPKQDWLNQKDVVPADMEGWLYIDDIIFETNTVLVKHADICDRIILKGKGMINLKRWVLVGEAAVQN